MISEIIATITHNVPKLNSHAKQTAMALMNLASAKPPSLLLNSFTPFISSSNTLNFHRRNISFSRSRFPLLSTHGITSSVSKVFAKIGLKEELRKSVADKDIAVSDLHYDLPLKIVKYPDPRLRAKNMRVKCFDESLQVLVKAMFDIMYRTDGCGLSAPQVGVNVQLMVFNPAGEPGKGEEVVLVNPEIYKYSVKTDVLNEGCLSFPNIYGDIERPISVKIKAWDAKGKKFILNLKEFHARIFQHEYDHLEGILFFERMDPKTLEIVRPSLQDLEQKYESETGMPAPEKV